MNGLKSLWKLRVSSMAFLALLLAGCGGGSGGGDPIPGGGGNTQLPPQVIAVTPQSNATQVPINSPVITVAFNVAVAPIEGTASFLVTCDPPGLNPTGTVALDATRTIATYSLAPATSLAPNTVYTATVTGVRSLATGIPMMGSHVWSFTSGAVPDGVRPSVTLTVPAEDGINVDIHASIQAAFSEAMDPLTINAVTFRVQESGPPLGLALSGEVAYDAQSHIATFTPSSGLAVGTSYTATIADTRDLAGNVLATGLVPNPWTFTTGSGLAPGAVPLISAGKFALMATESITNTGFSIINGELSLSPGTSMTGFPPGVVNGELHINCIVSARARADLLIAFNFAKTLPPGTMISAGDDLGALYPLGIPPGTYTSGSTMLVSTPLVLDAGGNADAVWVFQIGSSLTTAASVSLANGAQAKNVFWVPTLDATLGIGTPFNGTIISGRNVAGATGATVNGRILAGATTAGTIVLDANTINVPAP